MILVDADACPVRAEVEVVANRRGIRVVMVSDGGLRPSANPLIEMIYVSEGPDAADDWIAEKATESDVVVTTDIPLAARVIARGANVVKPDGSCLDASNIGPAVAARDLMTELRSADPFRQGGGRPFSKSDRSRFRDALDRMLRKAAAR